MITNLNSYGIDTFNPLLNPPEIGILGVGAIQETAVVIDGEIVVRSIAKPEPLVLIIERGMELLLRNSYNR
ncbi:MAG: hypothetical protein Ct9H300mP19_16690 [Dehalococcoidia bacterium]|nr:MAG: hypothetical protein Ct9H300mP19_16690 [Dehalococcoidia bacterium]